jgi:hypothetical protein
MTDKPTKQTRIPLDNQNIILKTYEDGTTAIESDLMDELEEDNVELTAAFDAIETFILCQYTAGIKVGSAAYAQSLDEALETIVNNLD